MRVEDRERPHARLPFVIHVLALGTFLVGTTELANVVGVPLGALAGQLVGWRPFWALAAVALASTGLISRHVPHDGPLTLIPTIALAVTDRRRWAAV